LTLVFRTISFPFANVHNYFGTKTQAIRKYDHIIVNTRVSPDTAMHANHWRHDCLARTKTNGLSLWHLCMLCMLYQAWDLSPIDKAYMAIYFPNVSWDWHWENLGWVLFAIANVRRRVFAVATYSDLSICLDHRENEKTQMTINSAILISRTML